MKTAFIHPTTSGCPICSRYSARYEDTWVGKMGLSSLSDWSTKNKALGAVTRPSWNGMKMKPQATCHLFQKGLLCGRVLWEKASGIKSFLDRLVCEVMPVWTRQKRCCQEWDVPAPISTPLGHQRDALTLPSTGNRGRRNQRASRYRNGVMLTNLAAAMHWLTRVNKRNISKDQKRKRQCRRWREGEWLLWRD